MPWRPQGCARNGLARRRIGGNNLAHLQFDQEITALLVIDSGNHLVGGGAVQAAGGGLGAAAEDKAIRPFHINIPDEALVGLR
jgi:hypothetical protein